MYFTGAPPRGLGQGCYNCRKRTGKTYCLRPLLGGLKQGVVTLLMANVEVMFVRAECG